MSCSPGGFGGFGSAASQPAVGSTGSFGGGAGGTFGGSSATLSFGGGTQATTNAKPIAPVFGAPPATTTSSGTVLPRISSGPHESHESTHYFCSSLAGNVQAQFREPLLVATCFKVGACCRRLFVQRDAELLVRKQQHDQSRRRRVFQQLAAAGEARRGQHPFLPHKDVDGAVMFAVIVQHSGAKNHFHCCLVILHSRVV